MSTESLLIDCVYFLAATLTFVPLFRFLGLGSTLGYLTAGLVFGPDLLGFIDNSNFIFKLSEFGLILLLFVIGLELSPRRLSQLKSRIVSDGLIQFSLTSLLLTYLFIKLGNDTTSSLILACAFSISSTAFVLSYLKESKQLTLSYGQSSFGILLFQDLIIIPILTLIPFMTNHSEGFSHINFIDILIPIASLSTMAIFGHFALKPLISFVHKKANNEVFTATCFLLVLGASFLVAKIGLSKALGAFMAGIFLSDFEFKKEIENVITPFKGMLLGTFFMSFGLQFKVLFIQEHLKEILILSSLLFSIKGIVLMGMGRLKLKDWKKAIKLTLFMTPGGEFGFVVLATALSHGVISKELSQVTSSTILVSLFVAPLFAKLATFLDGPLEQQNDTDYGDNILNLPTGDEVLENKKVKIAS